MHLDKSHSNNGCVIILARPADSLCLVLPAFLREYRFVCTVCAHIYEVLIQLNASEIIRPAVLIVRPSMLTAESLAFLGRQYPKLHIIGWLEREERLSDLSFGSNKGHIIPMTAGLKQLERMLKTLCRLGSVQDKQQPNEMRMLEHTRDVLTEQEVEALLGAG
ncbi:MAG: hypothetical protein KBI46_05605 [Phycisphaerae bacterium]|nr:hypothetical protein [Phycisphaerae bacterium]